MEKEIIGTNENENFANIEVGQDTPQVEPGMVMIEKTTKEEIDFGNSNKGTKIIFHVTHPKSNELLQISKLTYLSGKTIKTTGIWFKLDNDGKLPFKSAIAELLRYKRKNKISELIGEQVETVADDNGYLVLKAY